MKKVFRFFYTITIIALSVSMVSCSDDSPSNPADGVYNGEYGTVTGKFTTPNGKPISGVEVSVVSNYSNLVTVFSDANGGFTHTKVPVGKQEIKGAKGNFSAVNQVTIQKNKTANIKDVLIQPNNKLAYVFGYYDEIQDIIGELGYNSFMLSVGDLEDPSKLNYSNYSALFLNCGADDDFNPEVKTTLINFLKDGGLIYASDLTARYVEFLFPGQFSYLEDGKEQEVMATIIDDQIKTNLGKDKINIVYDLDGWFQIGSISSEFKVIVQGSYYDNRNNLKANRPLAVYRKEGKGVLVYTTFHNSVNISDDIKKILEEFIFF